VGLRDLRELLLALGRSLFPGEKKLACCHPR